LGMKKIILSITLLFFIISGYSQVTKPATLDSLATISFPQGYQEKDTLNEHIFTGNGVYGYMIAIREANAKNNTPLKKEKDLNKVLKDYIAGIKAQSGGSAALNIRDTTIGTLKAKTFTLEIDNGGPGSITYRNFVLIYTRDATYTFEYVYPDNRATLVKDEYKAFIGSIKLSPELQRNDQYLSNATGMPATTKIEIFGGAGLVVILVIILIVRRRRSLAVS
jgi:hypothetical protein